MEDKFFWFPLHAGDFLSRTALFNAEEAGIYVLLLVHLTRHERLSGKAEELAMICKGASLRSIKKVLKSGLFEKDKLGWFCYEMENHKVNSIMISQQKSAAGKAGARARWHAKNQNEMEL